MKKYVFLLLSFVSVVSAQDSDVFADDTQASMAAQGEEPRVFVKSIDASADEMRSVNIQHTQMLESVMSRAEALESLVDKYPSLKFILSDDDPYELKLKDTLRVLYQDKVAARKEAEKELEKAEAELARAASFMPPPTVGAGVPYPMQGNPFSAPPAGAMANSIGGVPATGLTADQMGNPQPNIATPQPAKKKPKPLTSDLIVYAQLGTVGPDGVRVSPVRAIVDTGAAFTKSLKVGESFDYGGKKFVLRGVTKRDPESLMVTFETGGVLVNFAYPLVQRGG
ncbi:hypothetical protein N9M08_05850 [Porticoccaceae bacterium]|nr:hypothetical protein [Porticoccaceae bacterium]MDA8788773.1 hypothetical protein [Porticoccaceae bacterium]MDB2343054.1 hypothetical protein [Porticoccaceae bacterium]